MCRGTIRAALPPPWPPRGCCCGTQTHLDVLQPHHQVSEGLWVCVIESLGPWVAQSEQERLVTHVIWRVSTGCVCVCVQQERGCNVVQRAGNLRTIGTAALPPSRWAASSKTKPQSNPRQGPGNAVLYGKSVIIINQHPPATVQCVLLVLRLCCSRSCSQNWLPRPRAAF